MSVRAWIRRFGNNGWTARNYQVFRIALGAYLLVHFASLIAWAPELWSSAGMLPSADLSPLARLFPNVLVWLDDPIETVCLLVAATCLSGFLLIGTADRAAALALWYVLACLLGRNPLIANPSLPFVGWLLLAHALLGPTPRERESNSWQMPSELFACAWIVMAVGYSYSGLSKLASPSWLDGTALVAVLDNPLARPGVAREVLLASPMPALMAATWAALALEIGFLGLALVRSFRPLLWLAMTGMHLSLIVLIDFADLSAAMLLLHLFTFDPSWLRRDWSAVAKRAGELAFLSFSQRRFV